MSREAVPKFRRSRFRWSLGWLSVVRAKGHGPSMRGPTKETGLHMRKSVIGVGFALTAAAIAIVGCNNNKGSTSIIGNSGELSGGNLQATSIQSNNLAPDGGGFSENNETATLGLFACTFNAPNPTSDAAIVGSNTVSVVADSTAMFFFTTADNGTTSNVAN